MECLNLGPFCYEHQAQDVPKTPQDAPRGAQEPPKTHQNPFKIHTYVENVENQKNIEKPMKNQ